MWEVTTWIKTEAKPGISIDEAVRRNIKAVDEHRYAMDVVTFRMEKAKRVVPALRKSIGKKKSVIVMKRRTA
jgi:hypothetical protein